LIKRTET